jgi:type IV secretory pathway TraG/TraD family ATPase VirD4
MKFNEIIEIPEIPVLNQKTKDFIFAPTTLTILGALVFLWLLSLGESKGKDKLANSSWGGKAELARAKKIADKQIDKPSRNTVSLYINVDPKVKKKLKQEWRKKHWKVPVKNSNSPTFYIPDAQRGTAVIGAAGTGKTFSVIDPMVRASVDQGFPTLVYDFKYPAQTKRIAAYAAARGYKVRIFAPGYTESYTVNPLDFLRDEEDAVAAGQLAQTINKNLNSGGANKGGDKFFEQAGDSLVEGIFLLTKAVPKILAARNPKEYANPDGSPNKIALSYCDLMTAQSILSLDNVAERLFYARKQGKIREWTSIPLSQVIATKDSEKTVAGIVSTAITVFQRFLKKDFIGSFCGDTNLNLDVDGKELVIFGLDRNNRDIVAPLLAAIFHMIVSRNVSRTIPRKDPLVTFIDELPTIFLPQLTNWLNENREDGFCGVLGFQNMNQLEEKYGREISKTIVGGCATKFIFNPQEEGSAEIFSKILGETEAKYKTTSRSRNTGKGGSSSSSNNVQKKALFEAAEFMRLGTGRCVILNPNYTRKNEAYIPIIKDIKIGNSEIAQQAWSQDKWEAFKTALTEANANSLSNSPNIDEELRFMLEERKSLAELLFPLPVKDQVAA